MQVRQELSKLLLQYQTDNRTLPVQMAAVVMPFTSYNVGRDPRRSQNPTIQGNILANKTDAGSPFVAGQIQSILDLRTVGHLLKLLLGQPVTTGAGPYTHTFPVNASDRPFAALEMGHSDISKFYRVLGARVNKMNWDIRNNDQNVTVDVLACEDVDPVPTIAMDGGPTSVSSFRACSAAGSISNGVDTTLGKVVSGTIDINNNIAAQELANGLPGYSIFPLGELVFSGTLRAVFDSANAWDLARAGTSTSLKMTSSATIGGTTFSLVVDMPHVELTEKAVPKSGHSGLFVDVAWKAHEGVTFDGFSFVNTFPTVVLTNDVASY
ncbi:MAG: phage tail tube protein [Methylotenera sp.]|nr:phage tail tube protein [Methylotenera sp.]